VCGFAGFLSTPAEAGRAAALAAAMADAILHRGPDDAGVWTDDEAGVALAFRRLAILDLSAAGHQPMVSHDGRHVLVFNGEIYNAEELRPRLGGVAWRGHSDTEVLLEAIARWGIERTLAALDGMFAFALWDRQRHTLTLARDRLGEKPLYYGRCGDTFLFGSELKALQRHPDFEPGLDRAALALYLRWGWYPQPYSPYGAIRVLPAGSFLTVAAGVPSEPAAYWDARNRAAAEPFAGGFDDAVDRLEELLTASVKRRLRADVPVAVFLSGGVDSSVLAALIARQIPDFRSFTIGFKAGRFDESPAAEAIARHLGLDHAALPVDEDEALAAVAELPQVLDAPLGDPAALPLWLLSRLASRHVRVVLSGDGADELFGGYATHPATAAAWRRAARFPGRRVLGGLVPLVPAGALNAVAELAGRLAGRHRVSLPGFRLRRWLALMAADSPAEMLGLHRAMWRGAAPPATAATGFGAAATFADPAAEAMLTDALTYLPDDLCVKTDRTTMAASIEARLPFLDHHIAEFAWTLPTAMKLRPGGGKAVLRAVMDRHLPTSLTDRPKHGLEVPVGTWLKGRLKEWAGDLLSPARLARQGLLDPGLLGLCWRQHQSGAKDWSNELWAALMLQAWLDRNDATTE
jgi:asparagine synthase (glutamine-hydrolysing)